MTLRKKYNNNTDEIAEAMRGAEYVSDCNYILNAKFMTSILLHSGEMENKLSVHCDVKNKITIYEMQIIDELEYGKHSLDGENFNIFDHHQECFKHLMIKRYSRKYCKTSSILALERFHSTARKKLASYQQENKINMFMEDETIYPKNDLHMRLSTRRLNDADLYGLNAFDSFKLIEFQIPKYRYRLSKCIENYDNSLNFFKLPFSRLVDYYDDGFTFLSVGTPENNDRHNSLDVDDATFNNDIFQKQEIEIDYDWRSKIINGVNNYNSFQDLDKQIITHPNPKKIIKMIGAHIYFWRLIRICVQCDEYQIDEKIIKGNKECYKMWIDNDKFIFPLQKSSDTDDTYQDSEDEKDNDDINNNHWNYGYDQLLYTLFDDKLCSSWLDFKVMLEKFQLLDFNKILIKSLKKSPDFKRKFILELNDQDDDVVDLFEDHDYPTE